MEFTPSATEQTTAASDAVLVVVALACAAALLPTRRLDTWKASLWLGAFLSLAVASFCGAVAHGFVLPAATTRLIWQPLNLALGLSVAFFVAVATDDGWGRDTAKRVWKFALGAALLFFLLTQFIKDSFYLFIPYAALGLFFALYVYVRLAREGRSPGAAVLACGVLTTILAAVAQSATGVRFTLWGWQFDNSGLFHLIEMIAMPLLAMGARTSLLRTSVRPAATPGKTPN